MAPLKLSFLATGACLLPFALGQIFVGSNNTQASIPISMPAPADISDGCK